MTTTNHDITCPKYEAIPGSRRCQHYASNGACNLPDELMCVEWLRRNGHAPAPPSTDTRAPRNLPVIPTGNAPKLADPLSSSPAPTAPPCALRGVEMMLAISDTDIEAFQQRGVEVQVQGDAGDVWIVPEYTGQTRTELTVKHAALLAAVCTAFPGARVTSFRPGRK